jgi:hypothetical protein
MAVRDFGLTEFRSAESERLNCRKGALQQLHGWRVGIRAGLFGVSMTPWRMVVNLPLSEPVGRQPLFAQM